jgi:hypothetical protein
MHSTAQIEMDFRDEAQKPPISPKGRLTLQELLDQIQANEPSALKLSGMLRSTAAHLSRALCKPLDALTIEELTIGLPEFKVYLKQRRFTRNSIRSYLHFGRILLRKARELGWKETDPEVESLWQPILAAIANRHERKTIPIVIGYAVQRGIKPSDLSDSLLKTWADWMLMQGRSASYISNLHGAFRSFVSRIGLPTALSAPYPEGGRVYGVPFHQLPDPLRTQIVELLEWKVAKFSRGRPERCRHRPVTAKNFRDMLCRIYGFLEKIKGQQVPTLEELLSERVLWEFVEWSIRGSGCFIRLSGDIRLSRIRILSGSRS